jgi:hypothetical protein
VQKSLWTIPGSARSTSEKTSVCKYGSFRSNLSTSRHRRSSLRRSCVNRSSFCPCPIWNWRKKFKRKSWKIQCLRWQRDARADAPEPVLESTPAPEEPRVSPDDDNFNEYSAPKSLILPPAVKLQTKKNQFLQNQVRTRETLADHLMWQIRMADLTPAQVEAAEF